MDFTPELAAFQGVLLSADNVHKFSGIISKGGSEEKVKYVVESIKKFLVAEKYVDDEGKPLYAKIPSLRKFAMYIILNADLPVLDEMMESEVETLIWSLPTVPKYLMCEIMWQLELEVFAYDMIHSCRPQLGLQVAASFLDNFKYLNPIDCIEKLGKLSESCYELLCRINYFKFPNEMLTTVFTKNVFNTLQLFLKYYTFPPNTHIVEALSGDNFYKYKGERFKNILLLVCKCLTMYTTNGKGSLPLPVYKATYSADDFEDAEFKISESPKKIILDEINNSNAVLLDVFKEIAMEVNVDMYCAWSEFVQDGQSMQQVIGDLCHRTLTMLQSIHSLSEHPVLPIIAVMARKPSTTYELVNSTDEVTILNKIKDNNEESLTWLHALAYKEQLFEHVELVRAINDNIGIFDHKECFIMYNRMKTFQCDPVQSEVYVCTEIKLFNGCHAVDKYDILKVHFSDKTLFDTKSHEDISEQLNVMFNKFIADLDADFTDLLTLFYQNPRKVYSKIFGLATHNPKLSEPMLKLITLLKDFTSYCYNEDIEPCMISIMRYILTKRLQAPYNMNIQSFLCQLKTNGIISGPELLLFVIMPNLHDALVDKDINNLHIHIQLLLKAYEIPELVPYRAPLLIAIAQVMGIVRPKYVTSFSLDAIKTLYLAIRFQQELRLTYKQSVPESESNWMKLKVREFKVSPMNGYYYKLLWIPSATNYLETVMSTRISMRLNPTELGLKLSLLFPMTTVAEWERLWQDLIEREMQPVYALQIFHTGMQITIFRIGANRTPATVECLYYCFGNLMHIIMNKYITEPLTNVQVKRCCALLAHNLKTTNESDLMEIENIITPLFAYLSDKVHKITVNIPQYFQNTMFLDTVTKFFPPNEPELVDVES